MYTNVHGQLCNNIGYYMAAEDCLPRSVVLETMYNKYEYKLRVCEII